MAIRVRSDGTMWCAALTPEASGDTYIDDVLHYEMSITHDVIVALPVPEHEANPQWWWTSQAPKSADFTMANLKGLGQDLRAALNQGQVID